MATECSATTAFRALVMLSCLITIPAVAVSGKSLPEMFQALIPQRWHRHTASSPEPTPEPEGVTWKVAPDSAPASLGADGLAPPAGAVLANHGAQVARSGLREAVSMVPVRRSPQALPAQSPAQRPIEPLDRFSQTQERLHQLGATYYLLESWGQGEQLFRFCCRVAVTGSPDYTRYFEAINAEPMVAMNEVLTEVEAWRAGR